MRRLSPLNRADVPQLEPVLDFMESALGYVPNSLLIMARKPELVEAFATLLGAVLRGGTLPQGLSPLIAFIVSRSDGCQYCQAHTHQLAAHSGVGTEKLDAIWNYETSDLYTEAERSALRIAQLAAQVPNAVDDGDFDALKRYFSETQIVEVVAIISMFGFLNRWNDTLATPLEMSPMRHAEGHLSGHGWSGAKHR